MTDLEVANRALTLIGVEPIGSLADNGKAARTLNALLPGTKRIVLGEFPWSFATRILPLAPSGELPPPGYAKTFLYPPDALSVHRVYGSSDFRGVAEFRVLQSGTSNFIAANVQDGSVEFTARIDNVDLWPMPIVECLATRLASDAATALTGSPQLASALLEKYGMLASGAAQTSVVEENIPPLRATDYVLARK